MKKRYFIVYYRTPTVVGELEIIGGYPNRQKIKDWVMVHDKEKAVITGVIELSEQDYNDYTSKN